ncbi:hypothetical protein G0U57_007085, partial [Chelydra serpentina]
TQQASIETVLPDSQELFLTLEPIPSQPSQGGLQDHEAGKGTSAANVSTLPLSSPSQRLAQIRRRKNACAMKCSLSSCSPPALKELSRMCGGKQWQSPGKRKMNTRTGGTSKMRGGSSAMRGAK